MGLKKLVVDALALERFYRRRSAPLGTGVLQAQNP